jgi:hypothetical protein
VFGVSGSHGAAVTARLVELRWVWLSEASRVVRITREGRRGPRDRLHVDIDPTGSTIRHDHEAVTARWRRRAARTGRTSHTGNMAPRRAGTRRHDR